MLNGSCRGLPERTVVLTTVDNRLLSFYSLLVYPSPAFYCHGPAVQAPWPSTCLSVISKGIQQGVTAQSTLQEKTQASFGSESKLLPEWSHVSLELVEGTHLNSILLL